MNLRLVGNLWKLDKYHGEMFRNFIDCHRKGDFGLLQQGNTFSKSVMNYHINIAHTSKLIIKTVD